MNLKIKLIYLTWIILNICTFQQAWGDFKIVGSNGKRVVLAGNTSEAFVGDRLVVKKANGVSAKLKLTKVGRERALARVVSGNPKVGDRAISSVDGSNRADSSFDKSPAKKIGMGPKVYLGTKPGSLAFPVAVGADFEVDFGLPVHFKAGVLYLSGNFLGFEYTSTTFDIGAGYGLHFKKFDKFYLDFGARAGMSVIETKYQVSWVEAKSVTKFVISPYGSANFNMGSNFSLSAEVRKPFILGSYSKFEGAYLLGAAKFSF